MKEILIRTIRSRIRMWSILTIICIVFMWMYAAILPSFSQNADLYDQFLNSFPEEFLAAFNYEVEDITSFTGMISAEQFGIIWPILLSLLALSTASGALAGEQDKGTMHILLSLPLSRAKIYFSKYIGGLLVVLSFVIITILAAIPLAEMYGLEYEINNFLYFTLNASGFGIFIYSMGFLTSAWAQEPSKATFPVLGFLIVSYILNVIVMLKDELNDLRYISIFNYYSPSKVLVNGEAHEIYFLLFLLFSIVFTLLGYYVFKRKDVLT